MCQVIPLAWTDLSAGEANRIAKIIAEQANKAYVDLCQKVPQPEALRIMTNRLQALHLKN